MRLNIWIQYCLFVSLVCGVSIGCGIVPSHIHNEKNAKLAIEAHNNIATYSKNTPSIYSTMLSNIEKFKAEEEKLILELAATYTFSVVTALPTMPKGEKTDDEDQTPKTLYSLFNKTKNEIELFNEEVGKYGTEYYNKKDELGIKLNDAEASVKKAQKFVDTAKKQLEAWNKIVALFQEGFISLVDSEEMPTKKEGVDKWVKYVAKDIKSKKIIYKNPNGEEDEASIGEIFKDIPDMLEFNEASFSAIPDAPGIALTIMDLGLDLAEIETRRVKSSIVQLNAFKELFERACAEISITNKFVKRIESNLKLIETHPDILSGIEVARSYDPKDDSKEDESSDKQDIINDKIIAQTARDISKMNAVSKYLKTARMLVITNDIIKRQKNLLKVSLARLKHENSVIDSSINDAAWLALVNRGLEGLVAYHGGGLTPEDTANIIGIGQSIALAAIGARVD